MSRWVEDSVCAHVGSEGMSEKFAVNPISTIASSHRFLKSLICAGSLRCH